MYSEHGTISIRNNMKEYVSSSHTELTSLFWNEFRAIIDRLWWQESIVIGLSGGTSLNIFYRYIWEHFTDIPEYIRGKLRFCLLDERVVPVDHPDSNEGQLRKKFLTKLVEEGSIVEDQVIGISSLCHFERSDNEVEKSFPVIPAIRSLKQYSYEVRKEGIQNPGTLDSVINTEWRERQQSLANTYSQLIPQIDIALFGVGPDGHIASLFPHHPLLHSLEHGYLEITDSPKLPAHRITVSPMMIRSIPYVFVAFMQWKEKVFEQFRNPGISWEACPVKILLQCENLATMSDID